MNGSNVVELGETSGKASELTIRKQFRDFEVECTDGIESLLGKLTCYIIVSFGPSLFVLGTSYLAGRTPSSTRYSTYLRQIFPSNRQTRACLFVHQYLLPTLAPLHLRLHHHHHLVP